MNKLENLTEYIENATQPDAIPAEHLAGLYLQEYGPVKFDDLANGRIDNWAREVDGGQFQYAETVEDFARDLFDNLSEWTEEREIFNTLAPHTNWLDVWETELRHDWTSYQLPDKSFLFVLSMP